MDKHMSNFASYSKQVTLSKGTPTLHKASISMCRRWNTQAQQYKANLLHTASTIS